MQCAWPQSTTTMLKSLRHGTQWENRPQDSSSPSRRKCVKLVNRPPPDASRARYKGLVEIISTFQVQPASRPQDPCPRRNPQEISKSLRGLSHDTWAKCRSNGLVGIMSKFQMKQSERRSRRRTAPPNPRHVVLLHEARC